MNLTDVSLSQRLADELFDRVLSPLAAMHAASSPGYEHGDSQASYFTPLAVPVMQATDFAFPGSGTADKLIEALAMYWHDTGASELTVLGPLMQQIAAALQDEAVDSDGSVSVFCYAMF